MKKWQSTGPVQELRETGAHNYALHERVTRRKSSWEIWGLKFTLKHLNNDTNPIRNLIFTTDCVKRHKLNDFATAPSLLLDFTTAGHLAWKQSNGSSLWPQVIFNSRFISGAQTFACYCTRVQGSARHIAQLLFVWVCTLVSFFKLIIVNTMKTKMQVTHSANKKHSVFDLEFPLAEGGMDFNKGDDGKRSRLERQVFGIYWDNHLFCCSLNTKYVSYLKLFFFFFFFFSLLSICFRRSAKSLAAPVWLPQTDIKIIPAHVSNEEYHQVPWLNVNFIWSVSEEPPSLVQSDLHPCLLLELVRFLPKLNVGVCVTG